MQGRCRVPGWYVQKLTFGIKWVEGWYKVGLGSVEGNFLVGIRQVAMNANEVKGWYKVPQSDMSFHANLGQRHNKLSVLVDSGQV